MRKPEFITFTGADDRTSIRDMEALSSLYPIEWGILFSPDRQGVEQRYPGESAQREFQTTGLKLAAHLCGGHARAVMNGETLPRPFDSMFNRIQVNHQAPVADRIAGQFPAIRCIAQTRAHWFPAETATDWLFDASGGRGVVPPIWPSHPGGDRLVGFAGGIGPANVATILAQINSQGPYWIDMESGVRTADNWFDIGRCWDVCEAVYGT